MTTPDDNECCEFAEGNDPACFHVVALGASAGGLESLERFFKSMPSDSGMAFVVLQHLSPDFRSVMDELLARHTEMKIRKAEDDMAIEANTIYLNPPRKNMIVSGGNIYLSDVEPEESLTLPIDQFFRSLAQDFRRQAIAVVLSGTGSDGSRGVRDVYEAGGLVLAETEETAKFDGMPRSAQDTGCVHLALSPDAMPEALVSYINQALSPQDFVEKVFVPPRIGGMEAVFRMLRDEYGIDFSYYKPNTVVRRIERRISMQHADSVESYVAQLENDQDELNALYRDLLIGVTHFFRDREAYDYLGKEILPEIVQNKQTGDDLRVWVAGCASGEEAYTIAILIDEAVRLAGKHLDVKIFATDVHPSSLEVAGAGIYPNDAFTHMENDRLTRYFNSTPEGRQVKNSLRQMVVFAKHNVFEDAPFTKLDLISCRNLLIYFQPLAQKKALSLFHFGLKTRGVLMLGPSESPGELKDEFEVCNNRWKVFRKRRDVRLPPEVRFQIGAGAEAAPVRPQINAPQPSVATNRSLLQAYDKLLEHFVSAAFLIDDTRNLLHVFGDAANYLQPRSGRLSIDLLELVRPDLKPILASAIQRVRRGTEPRMSTAVRIVDGDDVKDVKIDVMKLGAKAAGQDCFVVSLDEREPLASGNWPQTATSADDLSRDRVNDLEVELRYAKETLQTTVEELETSNEELQATNEELVASNEELQSTNEELHSVNEELYTVNAEYQNKISELTEITADMENLLESTEIGTVFLDEKLRIRKYTGKVEKWFDLVKGDLGRRISAFANNLNYPDLNEDIRLVLTERKPQEREIQDHSGRWLLLRLHPYMSDGRPRGVVMTLIDISSLKQTRAKLQRLSSIVESSDDAIIGKDFQGRIQSWNAAAETLFGYTAEEAIGSDISLILPEDVTDESRQYFERIRKGESVEPIHVRRRTKHRGVVDIAVRFSPIRSESGEVTGLSAICRDISSSKKAENEIKRLALVASRTDNAVVITDVEGLTEWVNDGFTRITGYTLEEMKGKKPGDLLQGSESDPETIRLMSEHVAQGKGFNVELVNYTKDGRPYWLAIEARPLQNDAGEQTGFMAIERDITELKAAQAKAQEEVERRDTFLTMLSHELRNPLSAIRNGLEVLRRSQSDDEHLQDEVRRVVESQVAQMSRLLDDLLDVSRITQNKIRIQMEHIDLRETAEHAIATAGPLAEQRGCELRSEFPDQPVPVCGDAARLQQVQVNLLNNAIRHSGPGDVVSLTMEVERDQAVIRVCDAGDGISEEQQARVFDLFFQTDSPRTESEGGLGVGLSLVRDFVAKHNGQVTVHSDGIGMGSTFTVTLPLADRAPEPQSVDAESASRPMRIVVIEDQKANRYLLKSMLELDGHEVWEAEEGLQGLELIQTERPDVALVDIGLPDISGYEVARRYRDASDEQTTLLAALTGYGQDSDVQQAMEAGFDVHLVKPLDTDKLAEVLAAAASPQSQAAANKS